MRIMMGDMAGKFYGMVTEKGAHDSLPDWTALRRFCWSHPEAQANLRSEDESNFYLVGEVCNFWIRLIAQPKECSLYLHMFTKDEETK